MMNMTNETTQEPTADEIIEAMAQHLAGGGDNVDFETKCEELESEVEELEERSTSSRTSVMSFK
jgi:hypothetical protein